jgi:hypothetical protein
MKRIRRLMLAGSLLLAAAPAFTAIQTAHAGALQTYLGAPQTCQGGTAYNGWFGHGQVNALRAVGG